MAPRKMIVSKPFLVTLNNHPYGICKKIFSSLKGPGGRHCELELGRVGRESAKIVIVDIKKMFLSIDFKSKVHYFNKLDN